MTAQSRDAAMALWETLQRVEAWTLAQASKTTAAEFARARWERALRNALSSADESVRQKIISTLGDPPNLERLPRGFWDAAQSEYAGVLMPELEAAFLDSARAFIVGQPAIGVSWDLVNLEASRWARSYTFDLVRGIANTTRDALQEKVGAYFEIPTPIGVLKDSIGEIFDPVRADMIAITEVTRAATMGEVAVVNLLESESGIEMEAVFHTVNDERVCTRCGPLNGKVVESDDYAPLHPRCRCVVRHRLKQ